MLVEAKSGSASSRIGDTLTGSLLPSSPCRNPVCGSVLSQTDDWSQTWKTKSKTLVHSTKNSAHLKSDLISLQLPARQRHIKMPRSWSTPQYNWLIEGYLSYLTLRQSGVWLKCKDFYFRSKGKSKIKRCRLKDRSGHHLHNIAAKIKKMEKHHQVVTNLADGINRRAPRSGVKPLPLLKPPRWLLPASIHHPARRSVHPRVCHGPARGAL